VCDMKLLTSRVGIVNWITAALYVCVIQCRMSWICISTVVCVCGVRILVGAPKDNITDSSARPIVRQFVRPGVVYQCPLTLQSQDCTDIKIDRERRFIFQFCGKVVANFLF